MNDPYRAIAIMTVMARFSSTAAFCDSESMADDSLSLPWQAGKDLARLLSSGNCGEEDGSPLYEKIGSVLAGFRSKLQMEAVMNSFSEEAIVLEDAEKNAMTFASLRMMDLMSGDFSAVSDVDESFFRAVEKYRRSAGCEAAERFMSLYDYSAAGASLGHDLALAKYAGDHALVADIERKAAAVSERLRDDEEANSAFKASYNFFSSSAGVS